MSLRVVTLWKQLMSKENKRIALAIADPMEYENLFPEYKAALNKEILRTAGKCKSTDATHLQTTTVYEKSLFPILSKHFTLIVL